MHFDLSRLDPFFTSQPYRDADLIALDYDGVVAATEEFQMRAFITVVQNLHRHFDKHNNKLEINLEFNPFVTEFIGKPERTILTTLKERHDIKEDIERLLEIRANIYHEFASNDLQPNPYALAILDHARALGKRCIVVSNGRSNVLGKLNDLWAIGHLFDEMRTVDNRPVHDKVDYLKTLNIPLSKIVLIEDSEGTVERAAAAGIHAVYAEHSLNAHHKFMPASGIVIPCINGPSRQKAELTIRAKRAANAGLRNQK